MRGRDWRSAGEAEEAEAALQRTVIGDSELAAVVALPVLETLYLGYSGVSDTGVAQ